MYIFIYECEEITSNQFQNVSFNEIQEPINNQTKIKSKSLMEISLFPRIQRYFFKNETHKYYINDISKTYKRIKRNTNQQQQTKCS